MWDQPLARGRRSVAFQDVVQVRTFSSESVHDSNCKLNDPVDSRVSDDIPRCGRLDLDAETWCEDDVYSGMQVIAGGMISQHVFQKIASLQECQAEFSIRIWFIEHSGFGTAVSVFRRLQSSSQLAPIWETYRQGRDVHLIRPAPVDLRHAADIHVLMSRNAFGAFDILVEVSVDGRHEAKLTARVRGDTVRDIYDAAGYHRWLRNPELVFAAHDGRATYSLDETIYIYQGACVTLQVQSVNIDTADSESQVSTACPDELSSRSFEDDDDVSLLQFLAEPADNPTDRRHW